MKKPLAPRLSSIWPLSCHFCCIDVIISFSASHIPMNLHIIVWSFMKLRYLSNLFIGITNLGFSVAHGRHYPLLLAFHQAPRTGPFVRSVVYWTCSCFFVFVSLNLPPQHPSRRGSLSQPTASIINDYLMDHYLAYLK